MRWLRNLRSRWIVCLAMLPALLFLMSALPARATQLTAGPNTIKIEVFVRSDSDRCTAALAYFQQLVQQRRGLNVVVHDVIKDRGQLKRLWDLARKAGYEKPAVPMVYSCRRIHIGFKSAATTGPKIEDLFTMHVYTRSTCPKCHKAKVYLSRLGQQWPGLKINIYEITGDTHARTQWTALAQQHRVAAGLPLIHFSGRIIVGYQGDSITGRQIESLVRDATGTRLSSARQSRRVAPAPPLAMSLAAFRLPLLIAAAQPPVEGADDVPLPDADDVPLPQGADDVPLPEETDEVPLPTADDVPLPDADLVPAPDDVVVTDSPECTEAEEPPDVISVPLFGELRVSSLGMPAFTFLVGLIDGFNPCAMWVLVFLLSVLVNVKDRRKMIAIAGTFVVISGLAYFAFMAAWLNVFKLIGLARPVQIALGCMAAFIGIINIKDFFAFKKGISFSIPESQKPGIYARVRKIVSAKYLGAAIGASIVLAVVVNIVELLCTAGLPALYTQILFMQNLPNWANYAYLGLYNLAYMLDDSILLAIVVTTLSHRRLQEREGRYLKLVSGIVILALGLTMLLRPEWLQLAT